MNWTIVAALIAAVWGPLCGLAAAIFVDRRAKRRTAEAAITAAEAQETAAKAADKAAEAAMRTAEAEMRKAVAAERDAQAAHWAQITEGMQKWNESLQADIKDNARRIDEAELRALADKERADRHERLAAKLVIYLRKLIRWIDDTVPGEKYPPIPPELNLDL